MSPPEHILVTIFLGCFLAFLVVKACDSANKGKYK